MESILDFLLSTDFRTYGIPLYLFFVTWEACYSWKNNKHLYRYNDAVTSLSCGVFSLLMNFFFAVIVVGSYVFVYENFALFNYEPQTTMGKLLVFAFLLVAVDFVYYWGHRFCHMVNIGWAAHVVHHSSEDYNFSTALRQSGTESLSTFAFSLPVAFLGLKPEWYFSVASVNLVYQFFVHTQAVKKLPRWIEFVFTTPSHHRVHHATNAIYLDKNFSGMFIIWDRIFGTFEPEVEPCVYGITKPLQSFNPITAQTHYMFDIYKGFKLLPKNIRWQALWKHPGWIENRLQMRLKPYDGKDTFDPRVSSKQKYLGFGLWLVGILGSLYFLFSPVWTIWRVMAILGGVALLTLNGHLLQRKI